MCFFSENPIRISLLRLISLEDTVSVCKSINAADLHAFSMLIKQSSMLMSLCRPSGPISRAQGQKWLSTKFVKLRHSLEPRYFIDVIILHES